MRRARTEASPSHTQHAERTWLEWLRVECGIEKPSDKLFALTELDSNTWVSEVTRIRGKHRPLSPAGLYALRDEYVRTLEPAHALAAERLTLERTLSACCPPPLKRYLLLDVLGIEYSGRWPR